MRLPYRDVLAQREFRLFIGSRTVSQLGNYASITVIAFAVLSTGAGAGGVGLVLGAEALAMTVLLLRSLMAELTDSGTGLCSAVASPVSTSTLTATPAPLK